jgi:peptide chain release factor 1
MEQRYNEMQAQFSLPEVLNDHEKYSKTAKALHEIEVPVEKYRELKQVRQGLADARAMLAENDADLCAMAQEEIAALEPRSQALEEELKVLLLPKDPNDEKNVVLEIRAGTGGDEASLFAAEIFRMYTRFAEQKRWKVEVMSISEALAATKKSSPSSRAIASTRSSSGSRASTACSACQKLSSRAASTRPPSPSPCSLRLKK